MAFSMSTSRKGIALTDLNKSEDQNNNPDPNQPPADPPAPQDPPKTPISDLTPEQMQAEIEKWKALSRKNEQDKKDALAERDQLKAQTMTDAERALEAAKEEGRKAARTELGSELVKSKLTSKATEKGVSVPEGLFEYMDLSKLLDGDGYPDVAKIDALVGTFGPKTSGAPAPTPGLGPQGDGNPAQVDYSPAAIAERVAKRISY